MLVRSCIQNVPVKIGQLSPSSYSLHPRKSSPEFIQGPGCVTTSPTLLGPVWVWKPAELSEIFVDREVFRVLLARATAPATLLKGEAGMKMSELMSMQV